MKDASRKMNVLKNVFPPSLTFHITSAVNDSLIADKARTNRTGSSEDPPAPAVMKRRSSQKVW